MEWVQIKTNSDCASVYTDLLRIGSSHFLVRTTIWCVETDSALHTSMCEVTHSEELRIQYINALEKNNETN